MINIHLAHALQKEIKLLTFLSDLYKVIWPLMSYAPIIWLWTICFDPFDTSSYGFWTIQLHSLNIMFSVTYYLKLHDAINIKGKKNGQQKSNWLFEYYRV